MLPVLNSLNIHIVVLIKSLSEVLLALYMSLVILALLSDLDKLMCVFPHWFSSVLAMLEVSFCI